MTPSDWIAAGALAVAFISILVNLLVHKDNIKARRAELVTEKSIEAYRDLVENLYRIEANIFIFRIAEGFSESKEKVDDNLLPDAVEAADECYKLIERYRVYFPSRVVDSTRKVLGQWVELAGYQSGATKEEIDKEFELLEAAKKSTANLIKVIQKLIGVEVKE